MFTYLRIHREKLLQSIFEEKEILEEVYLAFRKDVARVRNDAAALDASGDFSEGARVMHALKGILSSVGAFGDAAEAEVLEKRLESGVREEEEKVFQERMAALLEKLPEIEEELRNLLEEM